jgi:hypothetical protein
VLSARSQVIVMNVVDAIDVQNVVVLTDVETVNIAKNAINV